MPRLKLTARTIDSLHVSDGRQVDYWDLDHPGFGVRVAGGGRKTWVVMYRHNGRLRRHSLGTYPALSLADARHEALQTMARVATGQDPAAERRALRAAETFGELAEEYLGVTWIFKTSGGRFPQTSRKTRLAHRVPLNATAVTLLRELRSSATPDAVWVCASSNPDVPVIHDAKKAVARVRRRMNVDFRGHDLRRTAASIMASSGVSRLVIAKVLNYVETSVTAVYDRHSYDAEKRAALDLWGRELQRMLRKKGQASVIAFTPQPAARQATA